jgi:hypothetical protein
VVDGNTPMRLAPLTFSRYHLRTEVPGAPGVLSREADQG